jgi:hypothetical protein
MTPAEERRLAELQTQYCSKDLIRDLYGLDLDKDEQLKKFVLLRSDAARGKRVIHGEQIDRYYLESLLQNLRLLPRKLAAVRLGMAESSLEEILNQLGTKGLLYKFYIVPSLMDEDFERDLLGVFPGSRLTTFTNHNSYCNWLHNQIKEQFDFQVEALHCVTSEELHESPPDYAHDFDAISLDPIGQKYKVWLDLKKPMSLRPDYCSTLLYARERDRLRQFVAGTNEPYIPEALVTEVPTGSK